MSDKGRRRSPYRAAASLNREALITYDTALPQSWFDHVLEVTKQNPFGHIVWCYRRRLPDGEEWELLFGEPVAVDTIGLRILEELEEGADQ